METRRTTPPSLTDGDFPHYRRVWNRVVAALLAASFVPLLVVGGGMVGYAYHLLQSRTRAALEAAVVHHQTTIDRFLEERIHDLELLAGTLERAQLTDPMTLQRVYTQLHRQRPWLRDLGVIDAGGRHLAYYGPYDLLRYNYRRSDWFVRTLRDGHFVSDVFSGFRGEPHFVVAVRHASPEGDWILRATVDANHFHNLVGTFAGIGYQDVYLIDAAGRLQSRPQRGGSLMAPVSAPPTPFTGVRLERDGDRLLARVWLHEVPWLCVVEMSRGRALADLHRLLTIGGAVFLLSGLLIVATVLLTTNALVSQLETARRGLNLFDRQLRRTSDLASTMELAEGLLHELADVLHNVDMTRRWLLESTAGSLPDDGVASLGQIENEVDRGRTALDRFLRFSADREPVIAPVDVHRILDDLVAICERDLRLRAIRVERRFAADLPKVRSDAARLRQVLQNLVRNAIDAIDRDGTIGLTTTADPDGIRITVADTGPGVPPAMRERIFEPLYTTKEKGTGLGLAIGQDILLRLGGRIELDPWRRQGAAFSVVLPAAPTRGPAPSTADAPAV